MPSLLHRRVLITRARRQASDLALQLESLGAVCTLIPAIEIIPPTSFEPMNEAIARLDTFDWLLFTSVNAVEAFVQRLQNSSPIHSDSANSASSLRIGSEANGRTLPRIAAIGPATARAIEFAGFDVALMPSEYVAESLSAALAPYALGANMLYLRAADARDHLFDALTAEGAHVCSVEAYQNRVPPDSISALRHLLSTPGLDPDAITFTSASTVRNLISLLESAALILPPRAILASIGPITSQALREAGLHPTVEASAPTIAALVEAIEKGLERT